MLIFLNGFMGVGKTYWGKQWAAENNFSFIDLDEAIEKKHGRTVATIFEQEGEQFFRNEETAVLQGFSGRTNTIVACGGGTCAFNDNLSLMQRIGVTVFLKDDLENIVARLTNEIAKRPVLAKLKMDNLQEAIGTLYNTRLPFYQQCAITILVTEINLQTFNTIVNHA
jgi:shikimate kinase